MEHIIGEAPNTGGRRPPDAAAGYILYATNFDKEKILEDQKREGAPLVETENNIGALGVKGGDIMMFVDGPVKDRRPGGYVTNTFAGCGRELNIPTRSKEDSIELMLMGKRVAGIAVADMAMETAQSTVGAMTVATGRVYPLFTKTDVTAGEMVRLVVGPNKKGWVARVQGTSFSKSLLSAIRSGNMYPDRPIGNPALNGLYLNYRNLVKHVVVLTASALLSERFLVAGPENPAALGGLNTTATGSVTPDSARSFAERLAIISGLIGIDKKAFTSTQEAQIENARGRVELLVQKIISQAVLDPRDQQSYFGGGMVVTPGYDMASKTVLSNAPGLMIQAQHDVFSQFVASIFDAMEIYNGTIVGKALENCAAKKMVKVLLKP